MSRRPGKEQTIRASVRWTAIAVVGLFSLLLVEGAARFVERNLDWIQRLPGLSGVAQKGLQLDPYEMPSEKGGYHWVLRPGFGQTAAELAAAKARSGKDLGAQAAAGSTALRVNALGFKGPEIDPAFSGARVLAIGDSCTFGIGGVDYPRIAESHLREAGLAVELVNGGVEGYSTRNVLIELERYASLDPSLVTIYIGWNSLFSADLIEGWFVRDIRIVALLRKAFRAARQITTGRTEYAQAMYGRSKQADAAAEEVAALETWEPPFLGRLEEVIDGLEGSGAQVALVTLPGLFIMEQTPSEKALAKGHLPEFTNNPYVLAKLTERYNRALRNLATRRGLALIDAAEWSRHALVPRDVFFSDSVHLTQEGLGRLGRFVAERLAALVAEGRGK